MPKEPKESKESKETKVLAPLLSGYSKNPICKGCEHAGSIPGEDDKWTCILDLKLKVKDTSCFARATQEKLKEMKIKWKEEKSSKDFYTYLSQSSSYTPKRTRKTRATSK